MFNLPDFPDVYNTRHIICVSCKEKFGVTEGTQAKIHNKNGWRVQPGNLSNVSLRHEPDRQQRTIVPTPHQTPSARENETQFRPRKPVTFSPKPINCPRCGADNRNWLSLNQANNLKIWNRRFPTAYLALLISLGFALFAYFLPTLLEVSQTQANILAIFILTVTILLIPDLSSKWDDLREDTYLAKILPDSQRLEVNLWLRNLLVLLIASFILPVLFFSIGPAAFQKFVELSEKSPEAEVKESANQVTTIFKDGLEETVDDINSMGSEMGEAFNNFPTNDLAQVEQQLEDISDDLKNTAAVAADEITAVGQESITRIETTLENELSTIETARKDAENRLDTEITADIRYLTLWGAFVGLPLLLTMMIVLSAAKKFAAKVDKELPPPVFYSVNNMTRLVTWEARQALEIDGNHHTRIQWMSVKRNELGGLDLVGLFRDPPEFDMYGQVKRDEVRAQKHTIHTDKWCRIIDAKIEDVMVPIPAGAPAGVLPLLTQSSHDAPANVRVMSPAR